MSKLILYDFECNSCGIFEELVKSTEHSTPCPQCGADSSRQISPVHFDYRMGIYSSSFPTMADKWARIQREKARTDKGSLADGAPNLKMY
jgi:putative FmdB family regulatory protein